MKKTNDILQEDKQIIYIKKASKNEVVKSYECYGWKEVEEKQHPRYENILEVSFVRPHHIKNKDDLQYLQVNMECELNKLGKLEKNKHTKSTIFHLLLWPFVLLLFAMVFLCYKLIQIASIKWILISLITVIIIFSSAFGTIKLVKLFKKEKQVYEENKKIQLELIEEYCTRAQLLQGEEV